MITVLGISGSLRRPSHTHTMLDIALSAVRENGARIELLELHGNTLPLYDPQQRETPPIATELRERIADAHAYIIGTPEYHGSFTGGLKNLFDYLSSEISGKLIGLVVATRSDPGISAMSQLQQVLYNLHAWSLPYGVTADEDDFNVAGNLINDDIRDHLLHLGRDIAIYGALLSEQFTRDRIPGGGPQFGFAPWYAHRRR